jgi:hypothetical protein
MSLAFFNRQGAVATTRRHRRARVIADAGEMCTSIPGAFPPPFATRTPDGMPPPSVSFLPGATAPHRRIGDIDPLHVAAYIGSRPVDGK